MLTGSQLVKNLSAMWETWVQSMGQEDPLESRMATHPSIFAWKIPWARGGWQAAVHGVTKNGMNEQLTLSLFMYGERY